MIIQLDFESEKPIYQQLTEQIIEGIAKGDLQCGELLPSVRSMAADIGINLHTVNKSYQQLKAGGYIVIHRRKGVVVNPEGPPEADHAFRENLQESLRPYIAESLCRGLSQEEFQQFVSSIYRGMKGEG